jgi:hypothetical protein
MISLNGINLLIYEMETGCDLRQEVNFQELLIRQKIFSGLFLGWLIITLMMEGVRTFETSVYSNETTRRYIQNALIFILAALKTRNLTRCTTLLQLSS